jgi:hypothetical protein
MPRPRTHKSNPTLRATFWFVVVMLPSWWVLAIALTGGCSFEPSALKGKPKGVLQKHWDDNDGGN